MTDEERLRAALDRVGLTNGDAAQVCGTSQSTLYRWLNGSVPAHQGALLLLEILAIDEVWNMPAVQRRVANSLNRE